MKLLFEFLKKVFKQWIFWLAALPKIYDMTEAYFGLDVKLPQIITNPLVILCVFFAFFSVWKEEKDNKLILEEKLKNPTDFEVIAGLFPFTVDKYIDDFEKNLHEEYEKLKKLKVKNKKVKTVLVTDSFKKSLSTYLNVQNKSLDLYQRMAEERQKEIVEMMPDFNSYSSPKYTKTDRQYNTEMQVYRDDLENFYEDYYSHKKKMLEKIKSCLKSKYFVQFKIKNIGNSSDENIDLTINTGKNNMKKKFGLSCKCLEYIPSKPIKPEPPKEINRFEKKFDAIIKNQLHTYENSNAFIKKYKIEKNQISKNIKEMNVGDTAGILEDEVIIDMDANNQEMDFIVKSKKSNSVIKKNIKLVFVDDKRVW